MTPEQIKAAFRNVTRAQLRAALELVCPGVNYGGCSKGHMLEGFPKIATGRPYMTSYSDPIPLERLVAMVLELVECVRIAQPPKDCGGWERQPNFEPGEYTQLRDLIRDKYNWGENLRHKLGYKKP